MNPWAAVTQLDWQYGKACEVERHANNMHASHKTAATYARWKCAMHEKSEAYIAYVHARA